MFPTFAFSHHQAKFLPRLPGTSEGAQVPATTLEAAGGSIFLQGVGGMDRHRTFQVIGSKQALGRVVARVEGTTAEGWTRDFGAEVEARDRIGYPVRCFRRDATENCPPAHLWLRLSPDGLELRDQNVTPIGIGVLSIGEQNQVVEHFLHAFVYPATRDQGVDVEVTRPRFDPYEEYPEEVAEALVSFVRLANKEAGGVGGLDQENWAVFLAAAQLARVDVVPYLRDWLMEQGFSMEAAERLEDKAIFARKVLSTYDPPPELDESELP